ncbi:MAG: ISL3 family transposase [Chloroflexi bacterium]|nr:ISL3 family transposase [Chloroflexota bacterium]
MAEMLGAEPDRWQIALVVVEQDGSLVLVAEPTRCAVPCPSCGELSRRRHSSYLRRPLDLPWRGRTVRLRVHTRRWFCDAPGCSQKIFAERFDGALASYARRTNSATELLKTFALQAGGEGGARLALKAGVPTSPDTLLRILHSIVDQPLSPPRVLGVDDVALRRGRGVRRYGTLLLNLETHRPIDLLEDRTAEVLANWLRQHPGVEVIVRDRAGAYAEGARQGAPGAIQVADRFHLSANASAALDEVLRGRRRRIEYVVVAPEPDLETGVIPALPPPPMSRTKQREVEARTRRVTRWQTVRERYAGGEAIRRIALDLGMSRMTVRRMIRAPDAPRNRPFERHRAGGLTSPSLVPYRAYLEARWQADCSNIPQLFRELEALGYRGSRSLLYRVIVPWRGPRPPPDPRTGRRAHRRQPRPRRVNVRWLCLRPPHQLEEYEREALDNVLADDERIAAGYQLLQRFRRLVVRQCVRDLDDWLADAAASGLGPFMSLARGIQADRAAVNAGLTLRWSTGPVEGHVTRVKLLKRQGYGRASTALLRRRVVSAA